MGASYNPSMARPRRAPFSQRRRVGRLAILVAAALAIAAGNPRAAGAKAPEPSTAVAPAVAPDVVLIVVDTLRADHLGCYGYRRSTSPEIDRELAARGALYERAYAPSPWTLPSIISLFSGRWPGELLRGGDVASFAVPDGVPTLAERLARRGYRTAAFVGNPTLRRERGFARGFERYYTPEGGLEAMRRAAPDVGERALSYLAEVDDSRPLFLYVHWIDPHDPYSGPEVGAARPDFNPGYSGAVDGEWPQALSFGQRQLPDPKNDLAQLVALYDGEIANVDHWVGKIVRAAGERPRPRPTLFVFTSDHGEELFEHGGWKHGHTLYEEQIRVPLILRWDGVIPAGARFAEPVGLIDLAPTILGATADRASFGSSTSEADSKERRFAGIDLLTALRRGVRPPAARPLFVEHLQSGPARAAVIRGEAKYVLFDREASGLAGLRGAEAFFWRRDVARLAREELFDLSRDPAEKRNTVSAPASATIRRELEDLLRRFVGAARAGAAASHTSETSQSPPAVDDAYLTVHGLRAEEDLDVTLRIRPAPSRCAGWFAGARDRIERRGEDWVAHVRGDGTLKQFRCDVAPSAVLLGLDVPPGRARVAFGGRRGERLSPIAMRDLVAPWPVEQRAVTVHLATVPRERGRRAAGGASDAAADALRAQLRALGYLQ
jgi:arylsulfatase A-like enzyme